MITGWIAPKRFGKTLGMTRSMIRAHEKERMCLTNYYFRYAADPRINADILERMASDEIELKKCSLGLDEIHVLLDPRVGASKRNRRVSYLCSQAGKRDVDLHYTTQQERKVEVRLWDDSDYICYPHPLGKELFFVRVVHGPASQTPGALRAKFIMHGPKYYPYYDTTEHIVDYLPDNPNMAKA